MTTLKYRNTFTDTLAFMRYQHTHSWFLRIVFIVFTLIIVRSVASSIPSGYPLGIRIVTAVMMVLLLLALFIGMVTALSILGMVSKRNQTFHTEHTITLDESGLTEATSFNTNVYTWEAIQSVVQTRRYLFLFIAQHMAHVVPRRAVASDEDWRNLHETVLKFTERKAPNQPVGG